MTPSSPARRGYWEQQVLDAEAEARGACFDRYPTNDDLERRLSCTGREVPAARFRVLRKQQAEDPELFRAVLEDMYPEDLSMRRILRARGANLPDLRQALFDMQARRVSVPEVPSMQAPADAAIHFHDTAMGGTMWFKPQLRQAFSWLVAIGRAAREPEKAKWVQISEKGGRETGTVHLRLQAPRVPVELGHLYLYALLPDERACPELEDRVLAEHHVQLPYRYEVTNAGIQPFLFGRGLGQEGYRKAFAAVARRHPRQPVVVMSNSCGSGSTSMWAKAAWRRLVKEYPGACDDVGCVALARPVQRR